MMETNKLSQAKVYVSTYAKYSNGSLRGEWISPGDFDNYDEFIGYCKDLHEDEDKPEFMYQDWENIPGKLISESHLSEDFFYLKDEMEYLSEEEQEAFFIWAEYFGYETLSERIQEFHSSYIGCYASPEEFAEEYLRETQEDLSEFVLSYFDYEKFARDLFISDFFYEEGYVFRR